MGGGRSKLTFDPVLEAEYARARLTDSRALILVVCVVATAAAIFRGMEQIFTDSWGLVGPIGLPVVIASSLALTAIVASSAFERVYLPWARVIVPIRNIIVAAHIAAAATHGQQEMLMVMPLTLIGPFFFIGFDFRWGLLCGVLTSASFVANAILLDVAPLITVRGSFFLLLSLLACAAIARHMEKTSRRAFLDTRTNAQLAQLDPLTGLNNRRVFDERLLALWPRAIEERRDIAVLLIDVDHFKSYNDHHGHQAGDEALKQVARSIQAFALQPLDILARYGGEEFSAVLYDVTEKRALQVAERMRRAIEGLGLQHRGLGGSGRVTISIGVGAIRPDRDRTVQGALQLADQALYEAKTLGRNRVEIMSGEQHRMLVTGMFSRASEVRGRRG